MSELVNEVEHEIPTSEVRPYELNDLSEHTLEVSDASSAES